MPFITFLCRISQIFVYLVKYVYFCNIETYKKIIR